MFTEFLVVLLSVFIILNIIFCFVVVFFERKNPAVTWAWLMVLTFLPVIGFIIYLIFGFDGKKSYKFIKKAKNDDILFALYDKQTKKHETNINDFTDAQKSIINLNKQSSNSILYCDNSVKMFHEGKSKFKSMLEDIKNAKSYIHMEYYIIRNDTLGETIINALAEKAAAGVEVKFLVDGIGNMLNSKKLYQPLIKAGGKVEIFLPPYFFRINYRDHRKICVIDGKYGYIGGLNIGNEYLGIVKRFNFWRDTHLRIEGSCLKELELRFIADWNFASKNIMKPDIKYFPDIKFKGDKKMQIVSSGPDSHYDSIRHCYFKMMTHAKKSIYVQTPYFVPNDSILEALRTSALSGVDVRIMIPNNPDHPFVYWASLSYLGELLNAGVKCYKYKNGFIHSKVVTIDSEICSVGTANMDIRSFSLNFEVNAFIFDNQLSEELNKEFYNDLKYCDEIFYDEYKKRSNIVKIKESFSRLISPML